MPKGIYIRTEQMIKNLSESHKGKKFSEEIKRKMSIAKKGKKRPDLSGKNHPLYGKKRSDDVKMKISKANKNIDRSGLIGDKASNWKGGRVKHSMGYILILQKNHQKASKQGYVYEHILIMEKHLGRFLKKNEVVHHINKIRNDNRISNLKLMENKEHCKLHYKLRKKDSKGRFTIDTKGG